MFAPYQVGDVRRHPGDTLKDANGTWVNDYGGYMSIGYDAKLPAVTTVADLLKPEYKGKVALNGDPTKAGAGFNGVVMAALASGGSADDISPGVDFFKQLKAAGNFLPVDPTPATIESGQTPVVIDWDYLNVGPGRQAQGQGRLEDGRPAERRGRRATTSRRSTRTPRTRRPPACGRSSSTPTRARTSGSRAARARSARRPWRRRHDRQGGARGPAQDRRARPSCSPQAQTDKAAEYLTVNWAKAIG